MRNEHKVLRLISNNAICEPMLHTNNNINYKQQKSKYNKLDWLMKQEQLKKLKLGLKNNSSCLVKFHKKAKRWYAPAMYHTCHTW